MVDSGRLHIDVGDIQPAEVKARRCRPHIDDGQLVESIGPSLHQTEVDPFSTLREMGNLGGYQEMTTTAKAVGGPDKLIEIIEGEAARRAAPGQRGQGALLALGAVAAVLVGRRCWAAYTAKRAAASDVSAEAAKAQLKTMIKEAGTDVDEGPNEPDTDGSTDQVE